VGRMRGTHENRADFVKFGSDPDERALLLRIATLYAPPWHNGPQNAPHNQPQHNQPRGGRGAHEAAHEPGRDQEAARKLFPHAGARFAARLTAGHFGPMPDLARALYARAVAAIEARDYSRAATDLEPLLAGNPHETAFVYQYGVCLAGSGHLLDARQLFTQLLSREPFFPEAYVARAVVAARLGDATRARADLAQAAKNAPELAKSAEAQVAEELGKLGEPGAPGALLDELEKAVASEPWDGCVERALALERAVNAHRRHGDEVYQERLKALWDAALENPRQADRWAELAGYYIREAPVRSFRVAPFTEPVPVR